MSENKQIEILLRNIQQGLKKYTVKELNDALVSVLNQKSDKSDEINAILTIVAKEYGCTVSALKEKNIRGEIYEAKQITFCMLKFKLNLSMRDIAKKCGTWPSRVQIGIERIKKADHNIKADREFVEKYNILSNRFEQFIVSKLQTESIVSNRA